MTPDFADDDSNVEMKEDLEALENASTVMDQCARLLSEHYVAVTIIAVADNANFSCVAAKTMGPRVANLGAVTEWLEYETAKGEFKRELQLRAELGIEDDD